MTTEDNTPAETDDDPFSPAALAARDAVAAAEDKPDDAGAEKDAVEKDAVEKDAVEEDAVEEDAVEEDAGEDEGEAEGEGDAEGQLRDADGKFKKSDQTLAVGRAKALKQRDAARDEAASLRTQLDEALKVAQKPAAQADKVDGEPAPDPRRVEIETRLDVLYAAVEELRADAKTADAAKVQREIDALNRNLTALDTEEVAMNAAKTASAATQKQQLIAADDARFNSYLDVVEAHAPELVKGSDDYDPDVAKEFALLLHSYEKGGGLSGSQALRKASMLLLKFDPAEPAKKPAKAEAPNGKEPRKPDINKVVNLNRRQPPDASDRGAGKDAPGIDVDKLTDEELFALPDKKLRAIRDGGSYD